MPVKARKIAVQKLKMVAIILLACLSACEPIGTPPIQLRFGQDVYSAERIKTFLDEIYPSCDERQRVYIWHPDFQAVRYALYVSQDLDTPDLRAGMNRIIGYYNDFSTVTFLEAVDEPHRAIFALVDSYDMIREIEMARFINRKLSQDGQDDFWDKQGASVLLREYGYQDDESERSKSIVNELLIVKKGSQNIEEQLADFSQLICRSRLGATGVSKSIKRSCTSGARKDSELTFDLDKALLKAIKATEFVTSSNQARVKSAVFDYLLHNYGEQR